MVKCLNITGHQMANDRQHEEPMEQANVIVSLLQKRLEAESSRVKDLEAELETDRTKIQGMAMLFDCMQEGRAENRRLNSLLKRRKLALRKLKKHLQSVLPNNAIQINWDEFSDFSDIEDATGKDTRSVELSQENAEDKENQHADVGFLMSSGLALALVL